MLYGGKRKQSDATYALFFMMIDSSDHITGKTGLTPTVTLSKAGASYAAPSGAVTEIANGLYKVAGNATDSNTLGPLFVHATATGADPIDIQYEIVNYDPFTFKPPVSLASTDVTGNLPADIQSVKGTTQTARDLGAALPAAAPGANGGLPTTNGSKLNQTADLTAGQSVGVSGDFSATMKTSLNAATPASVQNIPVDGTLQTEVNTIADAAIKSTTFSAGAIDQAAIASGVKIDLVDAPNTTALAAVKSALDLLGVNVKQINSTSLTGDGSVSTPWGPA